jgi:hypothetical protein
MKFASVAAIMLFVFSGIAFAFSGFGEGMTRHGAPFGQMMQNGTEHFPGIPPSQNWTDDKHPMPAWQNGTGGFRGMPNWENGTGEWHGRMMNITNGSASHMGLGRFQMQNGTRGWPGDANGTEPANLSQYMQQFLQVVQNGDYGAAKSLHAQYGFGGALFGKLNQTTFGVYSQIYNLQSSLLSALGLGNKGFGLGFGPRGQIGQNEGAYGQGSSGFGSGSVPGLAHGRHRGANSTNTSTTP